MALALGTLVLGPAALPTAAQAEVLFRATQAQPVEETQKLRENLLKGIVAGADYPASRNGLWLTRHQAELQAGSGSIGVLRGLHGDLTSAPAGLVDLTGVVDTAGIPGGTLEFGKLGTAEQKSQPRIQSTFLMVANRKALESLPEGADLNAPIQDQLDAWAKATNEAAGGPKFGFLAGQKGLKHRFSQSFMLPSYAVGTVTPFTSAKAEAAWTMFRDLRVHTNPA